MTESAAVDVRQTGSTTGPRVLNEGTVVVDALVETEEEVLARGGGTTHAAEVDVADPT